MTAGQDHEQGAGRVPPMPGDAQPCADFASCAAEPCDQDAVVEMFHEPRTAGHGVWVPLCDRHQNAAYTGQPIEYMVEIHGFIPGFSPAAGDA